MSLTPKELEKLAEAINVKWGGVFPEPRAIACREGTAIHFSGFCFYLDLNDPDQMNAEFIVWCLDRLEELGFEWSFRTRANRNGISGYLLTMAKFCGRSFDVACKTRAECCAQALLTALSNVSEEQI